MGKSPAYLCLLFLYIPNGLLWSASKHIRVPKCHLEGFGRCCFAYATPLLWNPYPTPVNSLAPKRPRCHLKNAIFNLVLLIDIFTSSKDNALRWMPWGLIDDKSTLVQVMVWCCQATNHYVNQSWPSSMSPYGVTRPHWIQCASSIGAFKTSLRLLYLS